ncbi:uncharacterized protein K460DRAFT_417799 [Cucurbitaria berberidis CBS 394.84]|uniref:BHLH domain-containing protein n=1 Tax=Cucurbitaria berberidis CBS 394.84 TaxID=1168544 RepID=A0A9P4GJL7_9PLEO|nr:uncharacterized protein K460DRAFT_417799 [Cucurbitaria berberidis CBS 394.84]KAF1846780.1 hypothetical protein K460DRAFT_417799 [Cucurbitaria berberidis CBS 394.84]
MSGASASRRKRVRTWTSEERAAHRVFEKCRREAFNDSMIQLARHIPSLAGTRRLNKHMIVDHSIARHESQRRLCIAAARSAQALITERDELLAEVNQWRSASAVPLPPREAAPVGQQLHELMTVEGETTGRFPNGFGDNAPENDSGDDQYQEEIDGVSAEEWSANALPGAEEALLSIDYLPPPTLSQDDVSATCLPTMFDSQCLRKCY